ncbi:hypothetical protein lbkm_1503 [Lachnospiraceae bacterium KM106-2]|nr:hypothetical protein lbkm_1503 [Lachnospiraceae bacterium KM106-2]
MNNKYRTIIFAICLAVIGVATIASFCYQSYTDLDEPYFLRSCMEDELVMPDPEEEENEQMYTIQYIGKVTDHREIIQIEFPDYPDLKTNISNEDSDDVFSFMEEDSEHSDLTGKYEKKEFYYSFDESIKKYEKTGVHLTNAVVMFSDGKTQKVDLGDIFINPKQEDTELMQEVESSQESQRMGNRFLLKSKGTLIGVNSKAYENIKDVFQFFVDDKSIQLNQTLNLPVTPQRNITISSQWQEEGDKAYDKYSITARIIIKNQKGKKETLKTHLFEWERNLSDSSEIIPYLYERRKGK